MSDEHGLEATMKALEAEDRESAARHAMLSMEKYLAYALCHACGEELGEDMSAITQQQGEDGPETIHTHCAAPPLAPKEG